MAYDLHIGKTEHNHNYCCSLGEQMHAVLFRFIDDEALALPQFNKMSDYYKDARFANVALQGLMDDIDHLLTKIDNPLVIEMLKKIKQLAQEAWSTQSVLFGFCD